MEFSLSLLLLLVLVLMILFIFMLLLLALLLLLDAVVGVSRYLKGLHNFGLKINSNNTAFLLLMVLSMIKKVQ